VALDDLSLGVPSGEFVAILGPNSAGKTTLVKVLATLLRPTGGNATVNGFDVARQASRVRASIAVVPAAGWLAFDGGLSLGANLMHWHGHIIADDSPAALTARLIDCILEVTLSTCPPTALRLLHDRKLILHQVEALDRQGAGRLRVHLAPGIPAGDVRTALTAAGAVIDDIRPADATLEDVFIRLTGRSIA
jgi:energy-coupling factor transporter ATP-binding protein EcfA2